MSSSLAVSLALLLASAGVIYLACEFFVNGVEWVGHKTGVSQNAVGTILAAFGTALPESVVTFVAVVFGKDASVRSIGIGAALGGPLVLSTIAYAAVGIMLMAMAPASARALIPLNSQRLSRDQGWFLIIFALKVSLGFLAFALKPWLGVLFLAAYGAYIWVEIRHEGDSAEGAPEPLLLQRHQPVPHLGMALVQTGVALLVIFAASRVFVNQLDAIGPWLGIPPVVVALLLSPVATELPEVMNAIIWIRQGKHRLALANISGAMMIQATIPSALGLFFTPWLFDQALALAAAITIVAVACLFLLLRRNALTPARLGCVGILYGLFAIGVAILWQGGSLH